MATVAAVSSSKFYTPNVTALATNAAWGNGQAPVAFTTVQLPVNAGPEPGSIQTPPHPTGYAS